MKTFQIFSMVTLIVGGIIFTSCSSGDRYVASSDDIQKFDEKEKWQKGKHKLDDKK